MCVCVCVWVGCISFFYIRFVLFVMWINFHYGRVKVKQNKMNFSFIDAQTNSTNFQKRMFVFLHRYICMCVCATEAGKADKNCLTRFSEGIIARQLGISSGQAMPWNTWKLQLLFFVFCFICEGFAFRLLWCAHTGTHGSIVITRFYCVCVRYIIHLCDYIKSSCSNWNDSHKISVIAINRDAEQQQ